MIVSRELADVVKVSGSDLNENDIKDFIADLYWIHAKYGNDKFKKTYVSKYGIVQILSNEINGNSNIQNFIDKIQYE